MVNIQLEATSPVIKNESMNPSQQQPQQQQQQNPSISNTMVNSSSFGSLSDLSPVLNVSSFPHSQSFPKISPQPTTTTTTNTISSMPPPPLPSPTPMQTSNQIGLNEKQNENSGLEAVNILTSQAMSDSGIVHNSDQQQQQQLHQTVFQPQFTPK